MKYKLSDAILINPKEVLAKGTIAKKISMDKLQPFFRDVPTYEQELFSGGSKFRNGDTIMARITPCLENGKTAKVNMLNDNEVGFGSTEFIVFRALADVTDENYVYYLVCSPLIRDMAIKSMVGSSGRQRVQTDVLANLELDIPDLQIQRKIGKLLKSIDDKIANNNAINNNLQQQAQAVFKAWFVDYEPFGGIKPIDWKTACLENLAKDIICGKTPPTKQSEYYGDDIPFITIPDMHNSIYIIKTERSLSNLGANSQAGKTLPPNSICVSCIGTAGLVSLVSSPSQTNQQINSIIPQDNISPYFVYLLMCTLSGAIQNLGSAGSTICNLNKGQFTKMEIIIPKHEVIASFHSIVAPLFEAIRHIQHENHRLAILRDALLPKLMSGEIDVSKVKI